MMPAAALLLAALPAAASRAARDDSTPATLFTRDGAMRAVLAGDTIEFGFTPRGAARVRRQIDSATAARPQANASPAWFDAAALARSVGEGVTRGMHMKFAAADVREVRAEGDLLTLCLATHEPDVPPCGRGNRLVLTGASPDDVRRFAASVEQTRARAARAR